MRGATVSYVGMQKALMISIHAPHAGSDTSASDDFLVSGISIHAPHAGSDLINVPILQSRCDFNPRSPCGERLYSAIALAMLEIFQSTLPMRGATIWNFVPILIYKISIHAPHAGSDIFSSIIPTPFSYFNPRSPCGERRAVVPV